MCVCVCLFVDSLLDGEVFVFSPTEGELVPDGVAVLVLQRPRVSRLQLRRLPPLRSAQARQSVT